MDNNQIKDAIQQLKIEKNALILAHYYTNPEIQEIADYVGDSYYLSKIAKESKLEVLVFCGVQFMGESAKILNPGKIVLMPDEKADCPMAHMVDETSIKKVRETYEDVAVVCYINSTAKIKALSDVCVTSSNAVSIVEALPQKNIYFIPDKHLGSFVAKKVPGKHFLFNDGYCPIHQEITKEQVMEIKECFPKAKVLAHPECAEDILNLADYAGSTTELIAYVKKCLEDTFIICTEMGILHALQQEAPTKRFLFPTPHPICPDMKLITLEKVKRVLETFENQVEMEPALIKKAANALQEMHNLAK